MSNPKRPASLAGEIRGGRTRLAGDIARRRGDVTSGPSRKVPETGGSDWFVVDGFVSKALNTSIPLEFAGVNAGDMTFVSGFPRIGAGTWLISGWVQVTMPAGQGAFDIYPAVIPFVSAGQIVGTTIQNTFTAGNETRVRLPFTGWLGLSAADQLRPRLSGTGIAGTPVSYVNLSGVRVADFVVASGA